MGGPALQQMIHFGTKLHVKKRTWKLRPNVAKVVEAVLLAPARDVKGSWLVRTVDGEYLATSVLHHDVIACPDLPPAVTKGASHRRRAAIVSTQPEGQR